jgi:hypothetical protein
VDEATARSLQTIATVLGVIVSLVIGWVAIHVANRATDIADDANEIAGDANSIATNALEISGQALEAQRLQADIADQARRSASEHVEVSRLADIARQRETQVLAIRPILPNAWNLVNHGGHIGLSLHVRLQVGGEFPLLHVTAILRGRTPTGEIDSVSHGLGALLPAADVTAILPAAKFTADGAVWEVVINYFGILGQWVNEHYEIDPARIQNPTPANPGRRLYRLEIQPSAQGAASIDLSFGRDFGDPGLIEPQVSSDE